jgi:arginase
VNESILILLFFNMISLLGIPFDAFSSFLHGPGKAPPVIRAALHSDSSNYFTERGLNLKDHPGWRDAGDLQVPSGMAAIQAIESAMDGQLKTSSKIMALGGDHSITYPIVKSLSKKYGPLNILHLDAHPDLYDEFEGNKFSHACPFARIMEDGLARRLVQVGIRTMNDHQRGQAKRFGVEVFEMKNWTDFRQITFEGPMYLSLDMDAIDPAFAPGVSHHEPGGFTSREAIGILQGINGNLIGADLIEFNPTRDGSGITAMLAAKLLKELLDALIRT